LTKADTILEQRKKKQQQLTTFGKGNSGPIE